LSKFLEKPIDSVFPITFDVRHVFKGESSVLRGKIDKTPSERLTRAQVIALAVP
jgi:hypothetical protein